ncbi:MAG TPA: A/G-specific adenine glycosylase [Tepidisphaeraceae bacterium]|nr:A/G-specific adenine glycosylase [Tepidisphaeraceae bacterium]
MLGNTIDFRNRLLRWYNANRRDLPWRVNRDHTKTPNPATPDPYHVLVSEAMLQQTQVATVIPYFHRFMAAFHTLGDLAASTEQEVLRLWQGLGYYSRARNLRTTAKILVEQNAGVIPTSVEALLKLPGIGRYTAGAIASLAFEQPAPVLDGNVIRVLCRLDLIRDDPRQSEARESLWRRAEQLLPQNRIGDFNSALMELGATLCTPRSPKCLLCPVHKHCAALSAGLADQIPPPPTPKIRPIERRWTLAIANNDRWLIEQRPPRGRWANMWQFITIEASDSQPTPEILSHRAGLKLCDIQRLGALQHDLTHRRYQFEVLTCRAKSHPNPLPKSRRWVGLEGLSDYPLPRPQLKVAQMISSLTRP